MSLGSPYSNLPILMYFLSELLSQNHPWEHITVDGKLMRDAVNEWYLKGATDQFLDAKYPGGCVAV